MIGSCDRGDRSVPTFEFRAGEPWSLEEVVVQDHSVLLVVCNCLFAICLGSLFILVSLLVELLGERLNIPLQVGTVCPGVGQMAFALFAELLQSLGQRLHVGCVQTGPAKRARCTCSESRLCQRELR